MRRLFIGLIAIVMSLSAVAGSAQARHVPELGCHRVYVTLPGGSHPIAITVCP